MSNVPLSNQTKLSDNSVHYYIGTAFHTKQVLCYITPKQNKVLSVAVIRSYMTNPDAVIPFTTISTTSIVSPDKEILPTSHQLMVDMSKSENYAALPGKPDIFSHVNTGPDTTRPRRSS